MAEATEYAQKMELDFFETSAVNIYIYLVYRAYYLSFQARNMDIE